MPAQDAKVATPAPVIQAPAASTSKDELLKLIEGDFASGATYIYINSLGKEVPFKEVTVTQQKTLSRIMIGNE